MVRGERRSELGIASLKGAEYRDGLHFPFAWNTIRMYPDTGESGDAYDAETFLDG